MHMSKSIALSYKSTRYKEEGSPRKYIDVQILVVVSPCGRGLDASQSVLYLKNEVIDKTLFKFF